MKSNKPKTKQKTSPLSFMFVLAFTVSASVSGMFGLYPNNPITQQYRSVLAHNIAPEFLAPLNGFLGVLNVAPIPEDLYQPGDGVVLDPGGWLLEQLGMTVPPLYGPDSMVVVFDPAGALLELFGVDVAALPDTSAPFDPAAWIFQQIGLTLPPESPNENPPDPAGTLLAFLFPDYDPESATETPLDPGGILLAWLIPGYQPPLINGSQNPPPDPGGQLLALLVSPQLFDTTNNPLNPGDVILSWLFPPASEAPLPSEQDVIDAAMTSIVATQPNLASLATNTPTPTLTLMPANVLTFTPTYTLTPTETASSVVIYPTLTSTKGPPPASTPTFTFTPTPTLTFTPTPTLTFTPTPTPPVVNSLNDPGNGVCDASECTLREAIAAVSPGGTITFASGLSGQTITLISGELAINKSLTIDGSSLVNVITISGNNDVRVFTINNVVVAIKSLRVADGYISSGEGAGLLNDGTLTITNSIFDSNVSGFQGGGITNLGTLTVINSTFSNNATTSACGAGINNGGSLTVQSSTFFANHAIDCGGAISGGNPYTVVNSTFTNNTAGGARGGGALFNNNAGGITVINSTLSGNAATGGPGGGISLQSPSAVVNLRNTIISGSTAGGDCYNPGSFSANINNLVADGSCSPSLSGSPLLGPLASNGGATQTFALLAGSPAIDAGDDGSCPSTDQRGSTRPQGLHCDIGSYESSFTATPTPDLIAPTVTSFSATSPSTSLNIPITAFTATDNVGVTDYLITQSSVAPLATDPGWTGTAPTNYTVAMSGTYTLYPWAKDAAGNVSSVYGSPLTVVVHRLILYWNFEEGPGSCVVQDLASGLSGSLMNMDCSTPWSTDVPTGGQNYSLYFGGDGTNNYVTSAASALFPSGGSPRTICAWAKSSDGTLTGSAEHVANYGSAGVGQAFGFMIFSGGTWWSYGGAADINTGILVDASWHHLCVTYDGTTVIYYLDGVSVVSAPMSLVTTANTPMVVGSRDDFAIDRYFDGLIDDVRLYDDALSPAEISALP